MRKQFFIASILLFVALTIYAGPIEVKMAKATAQRFLSGQTTSQRNTSGLAGSIRLVHTEVNTIKSDRPVYYIFNSNAGFVIVSADDRAKEILAYGDTPLDLSQIPDNMRFWLDYYKEQIEYLQSHPEVKASNRKKNGHLLKESLGRTSVRPLLSTIWDQNVPYNLCCPVFPFMNDARCLTGCAATSMSMLFHYWKYPVDSIPAIPGYAYYTDGYAIELPSLPSVKFDWDNMLNIYPDSGYTEDQAIAVATLMRHVGQAEIMKYSPNGSSATDDDIMNAVNFFGYGNYAQRVVKATTDKWGCEEQLINDDDWAEMLQHELSMYRPVVYLAYRLIEYNGDIFGITGHAFNVDGYDADANTYHVNWGWSGRGNGYFALNAFEGSNQLYNVGQSMIIGMEPPVSEPVVRAPYQVDVMGYVDNTSSDVFFVEGRCLTGDVSLTLNDPNGVFDLNATTISATDAIAGKKVVVNYSPTELGTHTATVTLSSPGAENFTLFIEGTAKLEVYKPVLLSTDSSCVTRTSFRADWIDRTAAKNVASYTLEVSHEPSTMLLAEADFSDYPEVIGNQAAVAEQYLPDGWTFEGGGFWLDGGCIEMSPGSVIKTDAQDFSQFDKVTVIVSAKNWSQYTKADLTIATSIDSLKFKLNWWNYSDYVGVLDCDEVDSISFIAGYFPTIERITICKGVLDEARLRGVAAEGDANYRLITGITDLNYTVNDLAAGGTFFYKVKAHYVDGTESPWSLAHCVTLYDPSGSLLGDVNGDGHLSISDLTILINYLLTEDGSSLILANADINGDGEVNVTDVTMLITLVLISS